MQLPAKLVDLLNNLSGDYDRLTTATEDQHAKAAAAELAWVAKKAADDAVDGMTALVEADKAAVIEFIAHYPGGPPPAPEPMPPDVGGEATPFSQDSPNMRSAAAGEVLGMVRSFLSFRRKLKDGLVAMGRSPSAAESTILAFGDGKLLELFIKYGPQILAIILQIIAAIPK